MASVPADGSGGVAFGPIDADSLGELRMLNDTTFPVRYNERFYAEVLTTRLEHTKYGACVREALMDGWMDRRCAMSLTGCRFRILLTPPLSRIAAARPAYWKGRVVGAICCRLEPHDVPGCVRVLKIFIK